jgi:hypothetical protein
MPSPEFETAVPAIKRLQTYVLDSTAARISVRYYKRDQIKEYVMVL